MSPRTAAAPLPADLEAGLKRLKLSTIRRDGPDVLLTAKTQRWTPEETLRVLVDMEIASRDASNCRHRMTAARFPVVKTLAEFNLAESSIRTASHDYLITLDWIGRADNVCLVGPAGTGKSHYLIGLGRAAVEAGHKVRYFTAIELVEHLYRAVADNTVGTGHRDRCAATISSSSTRSGSPRSTTPAANCCSGSSPPPTNAAPSPSPHTARSTHGDGSCPTSPPPSLSSTGSATTPTSSPPAATATGSPTAPPRE